MNCGESSSRTPGAACFSKPAALWSAPRRARWRSGAELSARTHNLPYEKLSADEVTRRFPVLRPSEDMTTIWDPHAGILYPEACIEAHLELAGRDGAEFRFDEAVTSWMPDGDGVSVVTPSETYRADRILLSAGAWMSNLAQDLELPLVVERQVLCWFEPTTGGEGFSPGRCPIFVWDYGQDRHFYGFPNLGRGVKVALMHQGEDTDPDSIRREVGAEDVAAVRAMLERYIPSANGANLASEVCMFTNTPDSHFLIDFHPLNSRVLIASPCSGHGFKFASAIGEILADLLTEGRSSLDIELFRLDRFE